MNNSTALEDEDRRKLYWLIGLVSTGLFSIATFVALLASSLQFFVLMPLETYENLSEEAYETVNVHQMAFNKPEDFKAAEVSLKLALQEPEMRNNPVPHYLLGSLYETLDKTREASRHYHETIRLINSDWYNRNVYQYLADDVHGALALIYYGDNNNTSAMDEVRQIRNIDNQKNAPLLVALKEMLENPQRADFHLALAQELRSELKIGKAREEFRQAIRLSTDPLLKIQAQSLLKTQMPQHVSDLPPLVRYYSMAGDMHETLHEDLRQAAGFYERAIKEMPRFELGYNDLAIVYRRLKDYGKAVSYAKEAVALNPDFYNPYLTLGDIELDREQYREAIQYFAKAKDIITRHPNEETREIEANIENQMGFAYELMNDSEKAMDHYREAIQKAADSDSVDDYNYADAAIKRISTTLARKKTTVKYHDELSSL